MTTAALVRTGEPGEKSSALAEVRPSLQLLRPVAEPGTIIEVQNKTREFVHAALKEGRDYGTIPGTDKKTMLKPGAERTAIGFGCSYGEPVIVEQEIDHDREVKWRKVKAIWQGPKGNRRKVRDEVTEGVSYGLYRYVVKVPVMHNESGRVVAVGIGSCSTMESKYIDRPRDTDNTVLKMAHKRALVAACLLAFGLSDEFTQDVEDMPVGTVVPESGDEEREDDSGAQAGSSSTTTQEALDEPACPKCEGRMWDNRLSKTNPKAPDFKCRNRSCEGVIWPGQWPPKEKGGVEWARTKTWPWKKPAGWENKLLVELFPDHRTLTAAYDHLLGSIAENGESEEKLELKRAMKLLLEGMEQDKEGEQRPDPRTAASPASSATAVDAAASPSDEGGSFADYGEELPHGKSEARQPAEVPPANGAADSVYVRAKQLRALLEDQRIPPDMRDDLKREMTQRVTQPGYAQWLGLQINDLRVVLAGG